jgi:GNAT superfamily N-acetyltransferase
MESDGKQVRAATMSDLVEVGACADLAIPSNHGSRKSRGVNPDGELALQIRRGSIHVIGGQVWILGFISFLPNADHLFVDAIAVRPSHQRQGLGSRLLAFAEGEALRQGLRSVRLFTDGTAVDNLSFFQRRGYRETGRCDEGDFSRVFYSKEIAGRTRSRFATGISR